MAPGRVLAIHTAPASGAPMVGHHAVEAIAGVGLAGDRYALAAGTYSGRRLADEQRAVTLVARESLDALRAEGVELAAAESRRNLLTEGIALNDLVGETFRVGSVVLRGADLAVPCAYLESLTRPGVLRGLVDRGGLRAEILVGGTIRVGDEIVLSPRA